MKAVIKFAYFIEKLLKITLVVILACTAPPVGFLIVLGIFWMRNGAKKTNYRCYNTIRKQTERYMRELDK